MLHKVEKKKILKNIGIVILILGGTTVVAELFYQLGLGPQNAILLFVLALFLIAVVTDGYACCMIATILGVLIFDYLVTTPRLGFSFTMGFPITLFIMLGVAIITSSVTAKMKLLTRQARMNEEAAGMLYRINDRLLSADGAATIAAEANEMVARELRRSSCIYWFDKGDGGTELSIFPNGVAGDRDAEDFRGLLDPQRALALLGARGRWTGGGLRLVDARLTLFSLSIPEQPGGMLAISHLKGDLKKEEDGFASLLAGQLRQALRIEGLREQRRNALVLVETEKTRSKFLRAVSHDLRTPLTGIIGTSSLLCEDNGELEDGTKTQMIRNIRDEAQWLLNMVQNVLSSTRLHLENVVIPKSIEVMEEIIAETVLGVRKRFPGCDIEVKAPEQLVVAEMDAVLISQVITNLLENALRHAGKENPHIRIELTTADHHACVSVEDDGVGLPPGLEETVFEPKMPAYTRNPANPSRGFGMGLSICKTIVEAHNGRITGGNNPGGGAYFRFCLPLEEAAK